MITIDQIKTPLVLHVTVPATLTTPGFTARAMLDREAEQYFASSVSMEHMSIRITSARLHRVPVQKTMAPILRTLLAQENADLLAEHPLLKRWATGKPQRPVARKLITAPDEASLEGAAFVYRFAKLVGEPPILAVARAGGIERNSARDWLKTARSRGIL